MNTTARGAAWSHFASPGETVDQTKYAQSSRIFSLRLTSSSKFCLVPPLPILKALADVYFANCQNQPYSYFLESSFRQRLNDGNLPEHLLLAFAATAARYSSHEFFGNRQSEATKTYARTAWLVILTQVFSSEHGLDLCAVQATNMLAIIDFTGNVSLQCLGSPCVLTLSEAGQHRLGWVKIGLAIRFAQSLRLNEEPDPQLPLWQQEEYRRVFWSVYLLDRFVSCCRFRPPTILDVDCTVRLPCSEEHFRMEVFTETPTLAVLSELPDITACKALDHFASLVLMASTLGHVVRYSLQQSTGKGLPPWDFRSDFAKISSILLSFENLQTAGDDHLATFIDENFGTYTGFDRQKVGHFIWSRGLYHLCCCLLHHPFLLYRCLHQYRQSFPQSFARESLRRCQEHAAQLTAILQTLQEKGCCARGSFLGYFAVVAGSIHRLYEHSTYLDVKARSTKSFQICLEFLELPPTRWNNCRQMVSCVQLFDLSRASSRTALSTDSSTDAFVQAAAMREFEVDPQIAQALINPSASDNEVDLAQLENLWLIIDYGWLSDANRTSSPVRPITSPSADFGNWGFEDIIGDEHDLFRVIERASDITGQHGRDHVPSPHVRSNMSKDWWLSLGGAGSPKNQNFVFHPQSHIPI
jgi:hypothetical protein